METDHKLFCSDSSDMAQIHDGSVDLIITSPAYPMIKMWDSFYGKRNPKIRRALSKQAGRQAFEWMHQELDKTWGECRRVLREGGMICVNVGDAVRTAAGRFQLFSNHSRILQTFIRLDFHVLPMILWHKKTNAPNKFMGSGMLPASAYVTLEHEFILIFRKGGKRLFKTKEEARLRRRSAFFWEERNKWFSDIWFDLPGAGQTLPNGASGLRKRSAAFPFELAYRLICAHSVQSDVVLDPFAGTGTSAVASAAAGRNSLSIEIESSFQECIMNRLLRSARDLNKRIDCRLLDHIQFVRKTLLKKDLMKYKNRFYGFPVMTAQETDIQFSYIESVRRTGASRLTVKHSFPKRTKKADSVSTENVSPDFPKAGDFLHA